MATSRMTTASGPSSMTALEQATVGRVTRWLMPLFCLMYLVAYIDRQNVSYAKLQMVPALGLSESAYGLGASLFFIGYFLFEAPANLILARVGARLWFARIMFTWGLVTLALGFTQNATMFYILRFALGVTEAGFFPGVLYVLTLWYPQAHRARMVGWFMIASAVANAVGSVVGGALLDLDNVLGLQGWQWVFIATGIPAVLLAPYVLWRLPSRPAEARWLRPEEKAWLADTLDREAGGAPIDHRGAWRVIFDWRVLLLAGLYIGMPLGAYGLSYWLPTIVKSFGVSNTANGLINLIPWTLVAVALWWVPRHAARHGVSAWHVAGPTLIAAAALVLSVVVPGSALKFAMLCILCPAGVREPAAGFLDGRARRRRPGGDQFGRQSGWLHRPEPGAPGAGRHRQRPGPNAGPGRCPGGHQPAGVLRDGAAEEGGPRLGLRSRRQIARPRRAALQGRAVQLGPGGERIDPVRHAVRALVEGQGQHQARRAGVPDRRHAIQPRAGIGHRQVGVVRAGERQLVGADLGAPERLGPDQVEIAAEVRARRGRGGGVGRRGRRLRRPQRLLPAGAQHGDQGEGGETAHGGGYPVGWPRG
jgi:MFS family permease